MYFGIKETLFRRDTGAWRGQYKPYHTWHSYEVFNTAWVILAFIYCLLHKFCQSNTENIWRSFCDTSALLLQESLCWTFTYESKSSPISTLPIQRTVLFDWIALEFPSKMKWCKYRQWHLVNEQIQTIHILLTLTDLYLAKVKKFLRLDVMWIPKCLLMCKPMSPINWPIHHE